ncbi:hypothetical protein DESUT3_32030 [Desulfuromonas versatilis]|uniref:SH3b domain-containing protein n=1 Tax=Desulfuromonas versatilis TaxID=2802975 RepID=A0ABN6E1I5_9BACT|nr:TIGR04211 family SH3 domain-containing protein [Desulfuromonas versatilis]BCR06134.1 hypothetical protein DESUT3_32030 [Desulfuromonas versatilis]
MRLKTLLSVLLALQLLSAGAALAATRYVSDELTITLRRGKGNDFKILKMLKVGTPLEVLDDDGQWAQVREPGGTTGYVLTQFLTGEPPKAMVAANLEKDNARLAEELKQVKESYKDVDTLVNRFKSQIGELETGKGQAEKGLEEYRGKYEKLREEARNVVKLQDERDQLANENQQLTTEVNALRAERNSVLRTAMIKWFLAGGGVLFFGWMVGSISRKKAKRSSLGW